MQASNSGKRTSWMERLSSKRSAKSIKVNIPEDPEAHTREVTESEAILRARRSIEYVRDSYKLPTKDEMEHELCQLEDGNSRRIFEGVFKGDLRLLEELKNEFDLRTAKDTQGRSALHIASYLGNDDTVKLLIQTGMSVNERDAHSLSPLDYACAGGRPTVVEILISHGAIVTAESTDRKTSLHWAVSRRNFACIYKLISVGCSVQTPSAEPEGLTPLLLATAFGYSDVVDFLLQRGAHIGEVQLRSRNSGLHVAALVGCINCARIFVERGASVHCRNALGETALHLCANPDLTRFLIECGTVVNVVDVNGRTPLHNAVTKSNIPDTEILAEMAKVNAQDKNGETQLHLAVSKGSAKVVDFLLRNGANAALRNNDGVSSTDLMLTNKPHMLHHLRDSLNSGVNVALSDPSEYDCTVELDFSFVGMIPKSVQENRCSKLLEPSFSHANQPPEGSLFLPRETHFLNTLMNGSQKDILAHPLVEAMLMLKWKRMRWIFYANFIFYLIMAIAFTFSSMERYMKLCPTGDVTTRASPVPFDVTGNTISKPSWGWGILSSWSSNADMKVAPGTEIESTSSEVVVPVLKPMAGLQNGTINPTPPGSTVNSCFFVGWLNVIAWYTVVITVALATAKEIAKFFLQSYKRYLFTMENWGQLALLACIWSTSSWNISRPCDCSSVNKWSHTVVGLGILLSWSMLLVRIGKFPKYGIYVQMLGKVMANFGRFTLVYLTILNAFALTFCVLLPKEPPFASYVQGMLKIFTMMVGELGYNDMFYEKQPAGMIGRFSFSATKDLDYPLQTHILYCIFVAVISISLMNLLVALAVSDIQTLEEKAAVDRLFRQTQSIVRLESFLFSAYVKKFVPKSVRAYLKSKLLVQPLTNRCKFVIRPNDPSDVTLPQQLKSKLLAIAAENFEKAGVTTGARRILSNEVTRVTPQSKDSALWNTEQDMMSPAALDAKINDIRVQLEQISALLQAKHASDN